MAPSDLLWSDESLLVSRLQSSVDGCERLTPGAFCLLQRAHKRRKIKSYPFTQRPAPSAIERQSYGDVADLRWECVTVLG